MPRDVDLERLPQNTSCTLCDLHRSSKNVCIFGAGEGDGFAIGEAPGKQEARTGKAFQGQAGQILRPFLENSGVHDAYITNIAKCRPPGNREPTMAEAKICRKYLNEEIATRKPKAILLLGSVALKAMTGRAGITEMNGQVLEKDGQVYVCSFHPAAMLYDPSKEEGIKKAFGRYATVLNGTYNPVMPKWRVIDKASIDEFLEEWTRCTSFSFDTESSGHPDNPDVDGLMWFHPDWRIHSIAFTLNVEDEEHNWALSIKWPGVLPFTFVKELMEYMVETQKKRTCEAQNGKYDCLVMLKAFDVCFHLDDDMGLAHWLVDENTSHGLKLLARQFCNAPDYALTLSEMKHPWKVPVRRRLEYNACDAAYTHRLLKVFLPKHDKDERWLYRKVIMPCARLLTQGERDGLYVDVEFLNKTADEAFENMKSTRAQLNKIAKREINWNSPGQVSEVLYRDLKLKPTVFTDGGAESTSALAIADIEHPIGKVLEEYRGHHKFLSTYSGYPPDDEHDDYWGGWREFMVGPYLFLSTKIHGTVTGRFSHRIHSTPRDATIRSSITAPPGWTHFQLDINQAELRTVTILSGDGEMMRCFRIGEDIHWRTLFEAIRSGSSDFDDLVKRTAKTQTKKKLDFAEATEVCYELGRFDPDSVIAIFKDWKEARKVAKSHNFGFVFGQSPPGYVNYAKEKYGIYLSIEQATQAHAAYFNLYHDLPHWHERQRNLARLDGFVRCMSGRKRHLPGIYSSDKALRSEAERQAINSPVQGFIGDYKSMIMVELADAFPETHLRIKMEHHDAIIGWIKNEHVEEVCPELYERANNPRLVRECGLEFPIKMPVDLELGRWGGATKWRPTSENKHRELSDQVGKDTRGTSKSLLKSPKRANPTRLPRRVR